MNNALVVKVGGSLYDLPDLGRRLRSWLNTLPTNRVLLVPGGGPAADMVRQADNLDTLGEKVGHWLALKSLTFTAQLLAARLPNGTVIEHISRCDEAWRVGQTPVLDLHAFAVADEIDPHHLPHSWSVTSDSLAARVAVVAGIPELILLKSCDLPPGCDWLEAARLGIVDSAFPTQMSKQLHVRIVNFKVSRPS